MESNLTFHEDLKTGLAIEQQYLDKVRKKYPSATIINKYKGYDIWIPEISKSIEVKSDQKSKYTNNIVIEIEMYGKSSGLMATTADFWVIYDGFKFTLIKPLNIIKCIFDNKLTYREFIGNGDNTPKKAFLIDKDILFSYAENSDKNQIHEG
jgi:hypothetical protein